MVARKGRGPNRTLHFTHVERRGAQVYDIDGALAELNRLYTARRTGQIESDLAKDLHTILKTIAGILEASDLERRVKQLQADLDEQKTRELDARRARAVDAEVVDKPRIKEGDQ